jgi:hypothetical protein
MSQKHSLKVNKEKRRQHSAPRSIAGLGLKALFIAFFGWPDDFFVTFFSSHTLILIGVR